MKKIIIIEDEANTRKGLAELLRQEGYWVIGVGDGREAFAAAANTSFDIALCDYRLPDIDGLQICRELKRRQFSLICCLITAYNTIEIVKNAATCGIRRIFHKPLNLEQLFATLHTLSAIREENDMLFGSGDSIPTEFVK